MTSGSGDRPVAARRVLVIALIGLATTGVLYVIGRAIVTTSRYPTVGFFGRTTPLGVLSLKSLLATVALGLAVLQVVLALWLYRKLPLAGQPPKRIGIIHRAVGAVALVVTLPIAIHCAIAYGVRLGSPRVIVHSVAGCFLYGAFLAKVLLVHSRRLPGWALPVAGGTLAVVLAVLWYSSALWYYNGFSVPGLSS